MRFKHFIPFDQAAFDSPLTVDEVRQRLADVTVKLNWRRWPPSLPPAVFEGDIMQDGFVLRLASRENGEISFDRSYDVSRPICVGKMTTNIPGSRITVTLRPQWLRLIAPVAMATMFSLFIAATRPPGAIFLLGLMPGLLSHIVITATFWPMAERTKAALAAIVQKPA